LKCLSQVRKVSGYVFELRVSILFLSMIILLNLGNVPAVYYLFIYCVLVVLCFVVVLFLFYLFVFHFIYILHSTINIILRVSI